MHREQQRIDLKRGLFMCPMCRQIANVLIPILPDGSVEEDDDDDDVITSSDHSASDGSDLDEGDAVASLSCAVTELMKFCSEDTLLDAMHGNGEGDAEGEKRSLQWERREHGDAAVEMTQVCVYACMYACGRAWRHGCGDDSSMYVCVYVCM
jgi:hypothetical protein